MSCYNACGECKYSRDLRTMFNGKRYYYCGKYLESVYEFKDTSECEDFEPKRRRCRRKKKPAMPKDKQDAIDFWNRRSGGEK